MFNFTECQLKKPEEIDNKLQNSPINKISESSLNPSKSTK